MYIQEFSKSLVAKCNEMPPEYQQKFFEIAVSALEHSDTQLALQDVTAVVQKHDVCLDMVGMFIEIIRNFRDNNAQDFYKALFAQGFTERFIEYSVGEIPRMRFTPTILGSDKLLSFKWRLDVSFCDSKALQKIPVPVIVHVCKENKSCTIEMNLSAFHKLRFAVALLVKKLYVAKNLNVLK